MNCPECSAKALILETRTRRTGHIIRRYKCAAGHRFTTAEGIVRKARQGRVTQTEIRAAVQVEA